ncbi:MAG: hypothetical protein IAE97_02230 [Chthoniobacterales bacterium]|nr:hypothetical protein [Chthoniobacterales bacterium]
MLDTRDIIRITGIALITAGVICLPVGWPPPSPKAWTSVFTMMAHVGEFFVIAVILLALGLALVGATCLPGSKRKKAP